ncbi:GNAT family N-acetyltransferase [Nocardioides sp. GY 10127]|uniref:GNAT family N-acetyltransferase n=1 Tax=Nocardioides sp. GY 10127 TaxID=2569762 RepID=UPI001F0D8A84|nr:GNAT family N-acetyltransferase [Nocardioides sp. GY 10127]
MGSAETVIRAAVPADAEAWTDLHLDAWDDAYTGLMPEAFLRQRRVERAESVVRRRELLEGGARVLLAVEPGGHDGAGDPGGADGPGDSGEKLIGFASAGPARDVDPPAAVELTALYVRAERWGTGLGHRLLAAALADAGCTAADPVYLWVLEGNERAIGFYRRHGFELDGAVDPTPVGRHLRMQRRP